MSELVVSVRGYCVVPLNLMGAHYDTVHVVVEVAVGAETELGLCRCTPAWRDLQFVMIVPG